MHLTLRRRSLASTRGVRVASVAAGLLAVSTVVLLTSALDRDHDRASAATTNQQSAAGSEAMSPAAGTVVSTSSSATRPRTVFVVGDSLTVGTQPWLGPALRKQGWRLTGVDARVGRPVAEGLRVLRRDRHALPPTVVIALGTNDLGASSSAVATWMKTARHILGQRRIVWVNLCLDDAQHPRLHDFRRLNAALARFAPRSAIQLADWCAYAQRHRIVPGGDGIHYGPSAYRQRAAFYARSLVA